MRRAMRRIGGIFTTQEPLLWETCRVRNQSKRHHRARGRSPRRSQQPRSRSRRRPPRPAPSPASRARRPSSARPGASRPGRRHRQGDAHADAEAGQGRRRHAGGRRRGQELRPDQGRRHRGRAATSRPTRSSCKKIKSAGGGAVVREGVVRAEPGQQPAGAGARQVTVIADVVGLDPAEEHDHAEGTRRRRRDAGRPQSRPVQGAQGRRPDRGHLHRSRWRSASSRAPASSARQRLERRARHEAP